MKRALLDDDQLFSQSSAREGFYERASSSFTPRIRKATNSRFNMYGSIEAEYMLQPEARTPCKVLVYDYSSMDNNPSTDHPGFFSSIPDLRGKECRTVLELDLALSSLPSKASNKFWFVVLPVKKAVTIIKSDAHGPPPSRPSGQRLTLESCLSKLKGRFDLPPLAVLDTLSSHHRLRLDRSTSNLYLSLLSFSFTPASSEEVKEEEHAHMLPNVRSSSFEWMGFSSSRGFFKNAPKTHHGACSAGSLADLVHRGIPTSTTVSKEHTVAKGSVGWQRVCFFLNQEACISVFRDATEAEEIIEDVSSWFSEPELHLLELNKGVDFLFHSLIKGLIDSFEAVMTSYRVNLLELEEAAFTQDAPNRSVDLAHTRLLHLQQQELAILRQQLFPMARILASLQSVDPLAVHPADPVDSGGAGHRRFFICEETLDFIEEVEDQVKNQVVEVEGLIMRCRDLSDLRFALQNYRSSVAGQMMAGVSCIFLPMMTIVGVYGTNFLILPELTWGVADGDQQPIGFPLGYVWMLFLMAISGLAAAFLLQRLRIF